MYFPKDEMDTSTAVNNKLYKKNQILIYIGKSKLYNSSFRKRNSRKNLFNIQVYK
jgi:hypothetical protein